MLRFARVAALEVSNIVNLWQLAIEFPEVLDHF
jgi:hypothetical protein